MSADFSQGGWVASNEGPQGIFGFKPRLAKVKDIYDDGNLDLILYDHTGERIGRGSPAMGGPTSFEPYCSAEFWEPIEEPDFASLSGDGYGFHLDWKRPHPEWDAAA